MGATDLINPNDGDPVEQILSLNDGGVHHAIECLGLKVTAEQALPMLTIGGTATIVGMIPFVEKIELHCAYFLRERPIQGSSMGSNRFRVDMPRVIDFDLQGRPHLDDWISNTIKIEEINKGYDDMRAGKGLRTVIDFGVSL
jgi:S-(hydroxymethyl)glutathione dehydrogenase/alcohol dehydrogenase